ncbi:MAG TPA: hypothetical protein VFU46_07935 [Gemmatimonadales bacterium]|nr:hypothetical protein [Gemmatimonadales bacterium]
MPPGLLALDPRLRAVSRLRPLSLRARPTRRELAALMLAGSGAALLTTFVDVRLGIPGHHIVLVMFPLALGVALVPRHLAGAIMSGSAATTAAGLAVAGVHLPGVGALTGLFLAGPLLDLALRRGGDGWRLYASFVAAGAFANVCAFLVRGTAKYLGFGGPAGGRGFAQWLPIATWTYALAGVLAGLLSAAAWFHLRARSDRGR